MVVQFLKDIYFPLIVLAVVYVFIALRKFGKFRVQPWLVMSSGAMAVLATGQISLSQSLEAVNFEVIVFLMCMFIVGESFSLSGYISNISYKLFRHTKNMNQLIFFIIISLGLLSPFFINDTMVIVFTPLLIALSGKLGVSPKPLLLTMAFAVTTGSVFSPIGNPQNLLIALNSGIKNPFAGFFQYLLIPTLINFAVIFILMKIFYRGHLDNRKILHTQDQIKDQKLAKLSGISFYITFVLIVLKITSVFLGFGDTFRLTYIAVIASLPIIIFSPRRFEIMKKIDWPTLIFFISMFILMKSVWETGLFQRLVVNFDIGSIPVILSLSVVSSQFISNVPFVSLYMPLLVHSATGLKQYLALAAGSTVAGNLFVLGAASNIIILQSAEKNGVVISFREFARIGIPMTVINVLVYWFFLSI